MSLLRNWFQELRTGLQVLNGKRRQHRLTHHPVLVARDSQESVASDEAKDLAHVRWLLQCQHLLIPKNVETNPWILHPIFDHDLVQRLGS